MHKQSFLYSRAMLIQREFEIEAHKIRKKTNEMIEKIVREGASVNNTRRIGMLKEVEANKLNDLQKKMGRKDPKFRQVFDEKTLLDIEEKLPKKPGQPGYNDGTGGSGSKFHDKTYKDLFPERKENRYLKEENLEESMEEEQLDQNDPGAYRRNMKD